MPELMYAWRTCWVGTQTSSTCWLCLTQSFGNTPYSHGWMTTSLPERGRCQSGGQAWRMVTAALCEDAGVNANVCFEHADPADPANGGVPLTRWREIPGIVLRT